MRLANIISNLFLFAANWQQSFPVMNDDLHRLNKIVPINLLSILNIAKKYTAARLLSNTTMLYIICSHVYEKANNRSDGTPGGFPSKIQDGKIGGR
jgi:hypothetical protein